MTRKRKRIRILTLGAILLLVLLWLIPAGIIFIDLYCQREGVPPAIKYKILESLEQQGIVAKIDQIKAGYFTGVILSNVVIKDYVEPTWNLFTAEKVAVDFDNYFLLRGKFKIKELRVSNGTLMLPLTENTSEDEPILRISDVDCRVNVIHDTYRIVAFRGMLNCVELSIKGDVIVPRPEAIDKPKFFLTARPLLRYISADFLKSLDRLQNVCTSIDESSAVKLNLDIKVPTSNIKKSTASVTVFSSEILYKGMFVNTFGLKGIVSSRAIGISDFRLEFDNDEYLRGNFDLQRPHNTVSGRLSFHGYPYKLLKAVSPNILNNESIWFPEFDDAPMSATIHVGPSPLRKVTEWNAKGRITLSKTKICNAVVSSVGGNYKLKNGHVDFTDVSAKVSPDIDIDLNGSYSLTNKELFIKADITGEPTFLAKFCSSEKFKKKYRKVWKDYAWKKGIRPHFKVDLYRNPLASKSGILLAVNSTMSDYTYKGVTIDQAKADVFVDFPSSLLYVNDLTVMIDGREANANLVWHGKLAEFDFELSSTIRPQDLLGLFNKKLANFLENKGLIFPENPNVRAVGQLVRRHKWVPHIMVELDGTRATYRDARIEDFNGSVEVTEGLTKIVTDIDSLSYDAWTLSNTKTTLLIEKSGTTVAGMVAHASGLGMSLTDTDFSADYEYGKKNIAVSSQTARITMGEWELNNADVQSVYDGADLNATATINNALFGNITFDTLSTDFTFGDEMLVADLMVDSAKIDDELNITGIEGKLTITNDRATMKGTVYELSHGATSGLSHNVLVDCDYSGSIFNLRIATDYFSCLDRCELKKIKMNLSFDHGIPYGDYDIKSLTWGDDVTVHDIRGTFDEYNAPWSFHNRCGKIVLPFCELTNVTAAGNYTGNRLRSSVSVDLCKISRYTIKDVKSTVSWEKDNFSINRMTGNFYGGRTTGEIFYNSLRKTGRIWLTVVDVNFGDLIRSINPAKNHQLDGKYSAKVDLNFKNVPSDLKLNGKGKLFVDGSNFWKVPLLSDFLLALSNMKMIPLAVPQGELGEITELSSDIEFQENKVYFQNMKTNGNVVLITADGYYWWGTNELDFRVKAKPLNPFFSKFLPAAIDPFAILLERRLKGKLDDPKWEEVSALRDLFRAKEDETLQPSL